jgi:hypothetical protein
MDTPRTAPEFRRIIFSTALRLVGDRVDADAVRDYLQVYLGSGELLASDFLDEAQRVLWTAELRDAEAKLLAFIRAEAESLKTFAEILTRSLSAPPNPS